MYIFHPTETPHGAEANVHRIHNVIVAGDQVVITVNSFANELSEMLIWQGQHEMPLVLFSGSTYPQNVYDFLTDSNGFFSGGSLIGDISELQTAKAKLKTTINVLRNKFISSGCTTPSGVVDTDEVSLRNIMGGYQSAVVAMMTSSPFTTTWRLRNNTEVELTAAEMIALGNAVLAQTQACYANSWSLKAQIDAADSIENANAVLIGSGWPTTSPSQ